MQSIIPSNLNCSALTAESTISSPQTFVNTLHKGGIDPTECFSFISSSHSVWACTVGSLKHWPMNHVSRQSHYVIRTLYCACVVNNTRTAMSYLRCTAHA